MHVINRFIRTCQLRRSIQILTILTVASLAGCMGTTKGPSNPGGSTLSVAVSPGTANVRAGATQSFIATVTGSSNNSVAWQVNGVTGGSASAGMINSSGLYIAPGIVPSSNSVTVSAISAADATVSGVGTVTLLNPAPVLTG